ncbi:MAG: cytochrome c maturation protein CcmE [Candidatus Marinimicrobia bacterium]|jgi:cytochrome c-type biogenesis protein CcmE|nr:cytochrome c maturation protein CcmE [Candidatus Neomarinimicrobiota bacterium]MBT3495694.1 cytochrome c maturation protein CcmE [Candidatus Neomarinimicrobiota bacterium]MBT3693123.1 cytochrome c maturation protein CcmE [Candidatus Neomarinimicrobiota bacterium]MBT3731560.1 cytochrome c maturation protein CcmE [Candidatus Neomarinimicrobiota bacterium]MBT4144012.1 cytochrome c maturation protein CcmE [Candidatus Neomarinimicrobiota bacterium]
MNSKNKFILAISGIVVVFVLWIYWVSNSSGEGNQSMVEFISVDDLDDYENERVRLGGLIQDESIRISEDNLLDVHFMLEQGDEAVKVHYGKTRPDLFKDGAEVIVEGIYTAGIFQADMLQTKCASRYEGDLRDESDYNMDEVEI